MSSDQELNFLQSLLGSKEINALVNVHSKVAKVGKDEKFAPIMSSSMQVMIQPSTSAFSLSLLSLKLILCAQVALEVLEQLSQQCHLSTVCKELFHLLQKPHCQVSNQSYPREIA